MISVKPGRGPSALGAIVGVPFTLAAAGMTYFTHAAGLWPFALVAGAVTVAGVAQIAFHIYNATQKDRMSVIDLTDGSEEPDPIAQYLGYAPGETAPDRGSRLASYEPRVQRASERADLGPRRFEGDFCPFCGAEAKPEFDFCASCGENI